VKEFKQKSEDLKRMTGTESYEQLTEELRKDEKKLAVSFLICLVMTIYINNIFFQ
jgi:hypothetical protein